MGNVQSFVRPVALAVLIPIVGSLPIAAQDHPQGFPPTEVSATIFVPANSIKPGACAFDVSWSFSGKAGTIILPDDRFIFTSPALDVTVTNLDTSTAVTLSVTGAFHQSTQDGNVVTVVTGRNLLGDPEAGMVLAIGTFSFVFDANGNLVQPLSGTGRLIDVCPLIS